MAAGGGNADIVRLKSWPTAGVNNAATTQKAPMQVRAVFNFLKGNDSDFNMNDFA